MEQVNAEGGCFCGAIRYVVSGAPDQVLVCHCPDCRRAVGAQSVAWMIVADEHFIITAGEPKKYGSSEGVTRTFCATCGTALGWVGAAQPGRIDITLGSLDNPEQFVPTRAVYRRHRISWASLI